MFEYFGIKERRILINSNECLETSVLCLCGAVRPRTLSSFRTGGAGDVGQGLRTRSAAPRMYYMWKSRTLFTF